MLWIFICSVMHELMLHIKLSVKSSMYTRKNRGRKIDPCGTPDALSSHFEVLPLMIIGRKDIRCLHDVFPLFCGTFKLFA